jgi:hypothetical protein
MSGSRSHRKTCLSVEYSTTMNGLTLVSTSVEDVMPI